MARKVISDENQTVILQGIRAGGGVDLPYVYTGVTDAEGTLLAEFQLGTQAANELAEFYRQEAEFAQGERKESE